MMVFAAFVAFGLLGPIVILIWWLFAEWRALKVRHILSGAELGPTQHEICQLSHHRAAIEANQTAFFEIQAAGNEEGISRRVDGRFDERSKRARQLNSAADDASREIESHQQSLSELEALIDDRLSDWSGRVASKQATRAGVVAWLATTGLIWTIRPEWAQSIGSVVTAHPDERLLFGASIVSTGISLVLILVVRAVCRKSLTSISAPPNALQLPAN